MKQVTRNIDPDYAHDLLERFPRACLSYVVNTGPQVQPVGLQWHPGRFPISLPEDAEYQPVSGQEVVLLIDDGVYYFDLCAAYIRGQVQLSEFPPGAPAGRKWFEVIPLKTVA
ncbi:MAG: hypothetical protein M1281_05335 [Chloroflexi bacterium]|nr:hypothetical protein [Chloroflexota bacterium]